MEIFYDGEPLHAKCLSFTISYENGDEITRDYYDCERCHNRKTNSLKKIPVNPETFCEECKEQYKYLLLATDEG